MTIVKCGNECWTSCVSSSPDWEPASLNRATKTWLRVHVKYITLKTSEIILLPRNSRNIISKLSDRYTVDIAGKRWMGCFETHYCSLSVYMQLTLKIISTFFWSSPMFYDQSILLIPRGLDLHYQNMKINSGAHSGVKCNQQYYNTMGRGSFEKSYSK